MLLRTLLTQNAMILTQLLLNIFMSINIITKIKNKNIATKRLFFFYIVSITLF